MDITDQERRAWCPLGAVHERRPPDVGRLVADVHAVWRVDQVVYPDEVAAWLAAGQPSATGDWNGWPYVVHATHVGGYRPPSDIPDDVPMRAVFRIPATAGDDFHAWHLYPASGRWPQCSCCGEPMPCRRELSEKTFDEIVAPLRDPQSGTRR